MSEGIFMLDEPFLELVPGVTNVRVNRVCGGHICFIHQGRFKATSIQWAVIFLSAVTFSFGLRGFFIFVEYTFIVAGYDGVYVFGAAVAQF